MKKLSIVSLLVYLVVINASAQDSEGFVLVKAEPPIEVHERWVNFPGKQPVISSRELKSEFVVQATAQEVLSLLKNEKKVKSWQSHVRDYKLYLKPDTTTWFEYSCHNVPWPLSDQDSFMEYKLSEINPGVEYFIAFNSRIDPKIAPVIEDINRIELTGSWRMEVISPTTTKVTYRVQSVPTTNLPRMIIDPVIRNNMISSIRSMKEILEKKD